MNFYVNGIDQGQAATNVPENVFGVVDLYGQAAQATIIDRYGKTITSFKGKLWTLTVK